MAPASEESSPISLALSSTVPSQPTSLASHLGPTCTRKANGWLRHSGLGSSRTKLLTTSRISLTPSFSARCLLPPPVPGPHRELCRLSKESPSRCNTSSALKCYGEPWVSWRPSCSYHTKLSSHGPPSLVTKSIHIHWPRGCSPG